ncbi:hypothetical protein SISNIDRAFT_451987 [Sistotremastrum niveocremeum HHB9708]|uniref:F-box domain-containing protein n=1 Tax=Sistotremastrum niveocremeum HHB9708 TaxID=1314777 RepID=A0A164WV75_9AGAM|nr:hypothetical protein SISNIDRAFT_451987 [Sistotremastrum niveocremeum HHB9708]
MIMQLYEQDLESVNARKRLYNRRCRRVILSQRSLWSVIYLTWPSKIVDLYLQRSRILDTERSNLTIRLDTRESGSSHRKAKLERWTKFLRQEMSNIQQLELKAHCEDSNSELLKAVDIPAPRLQSFTLHLDTGMDSIRSMFDRQAPLLRTARLYTDVPHDLSPFPVLQQLWLRVGADNAAGVLETLRNAPMLKEITIVGASDLIDLPVPLNPRHPIQLPACSALAIKSMTSCWVRYIISNVVCPQLECLDVCEGLASAPDNPFLVSIFATLPLLSSLYRSVPAEHKMTPVYLKLHQHQFIVNIPGYRFETNWNVFFRNDTVKLVDTISSAIVALMTSLELEPDALTIDNCIARPRRDRHAPLFLVKADLHRVLHQIFPTFSPVRGLSIMGSVTLVSPAILSRQTNLPNLSIVWVSRKLNKSNVEALNKRITTRQLRFVYC